MTATTDIKTLVSDDHLLQALAKALGIDPQTLLRQIALTQDAVRLLADAAGATGHRTQGRQSRHRTRSRSHTTSSASSSDDGDGGAGEPPSNNSHPPTTNLEDLFRSQYPSLVRRASRYVGEAAAEDVVADVFIKLIEAGEILSVGAMHIAVRNKCFDELKHRQKSFSGWNHKAVEFSTPSDNLDGSGPSNDDSLAIAQASIAKHQEDALRAERHRLMDAAEALMRILSVVERAVIQLHFLAGLPYAAVATRLGITVEAARVRAHRAVARMREAAL